MSEFPSPSKHSLRSPFLLNGQLKGADTGEAGGIAERCVGDHGEGKRE